MNFKINKAFLYFLLLINCHAFANSPENIDANDYVSYAPYWWPNPNTKDGLPFIRKDGIKNKDQIKKGDAKRFQQMAEAVVLATSEYRKTKDISAAKKAVENLQVWFIEPETKINPNINHGQMIPGKNLGTKSGIIELRYTVSIVTALPILLSSGALSKANYEKLKNWFKAYYSWLINSTLGRQAATQFRNNHGSWYDAQVAAIAIFLGKIDDAKNILEKVKQKRIDQQIKPDGSQPLELTRTNSLTYSLFNLQALFVLAKLGEQVGVNLWAYQSKDGRSIEKAYQFVLNNKDNWQNKYQQLDQVENWRWEVLENRDEILFNIIK